MSRAPSSNVSTVDSSTVDCRLSTVGRPTRRRVPVCARPFLRQNAACSCG